MNMPVTDVSFLKQVKHQQAQLLLSSLLSTDEIVRVRKCDCCWSYSHHFLPCSCNSSHQKVITSLIEEKNVSLSGGKKAPWLKKAFT